MKEIKRYLASLILISCVGIGASFALKAAIGVGAYDAMAQSFAFSTNMKIGTWAMIINTSCVVGQILILRSKFQKVQWLQLIVAFLLGSIINFVYYTILKNVTFDIYAIRVLVLILAHVFIAFVISGIMLINRITLPLEGLCMAIAQRTRFSFAQLRQYADILSILIAVSISLLFSVPLTIREGTVIAMLIFGPMIGFMMPRVRRFYIQFNLMDE